MSILFGYMRPKVSRNLKIACELFLWCTAKREPQWVGVFVSVRFHMQWESDTHAFVLTERQTIIISTMFHSKMTEKLYWKWVTSTLTWLLFAVHSKWRWCFNSFHTMSFAKMFFHRSMKFQNMLNVDYCKDLNFPTISFLKTPRSANCRLRNSISKVKRTWIPVKCAHSKKK